MGPLEVTVTFSHDEALVLSDWLDRMLGTDRFDTLVDEDPAVWSGVYRLAGTFDTTLPEIFAADYRPRLERARQRLLARLGTKPRRALPHRAAGSSPEREVAGWIEEDNLVLALERLSGFVGYRFDDLDETALVGALENTDDETDDRWFEYPLQGSPALTVRIARAVGSGDVIVVVRGAIGDILAARIETLLDVLT